MLDILLVILGSICIALLWVAIYDSNRFVVTEHTFSSDKLKKDARVVLLSDLHNRCFGKENERLLAAIESCKPDFILIAGDMLTAKPGREFDTAITLIQALADRYPVYYGNGNHEHRLKLYPQVYGDMGERYQQALEKTGAVKLVNSHIVLPDYGITVYGAEIAPLYYKRFGVQKMEQDYMQELLGKPQEQSFNILLAHNPDYFPWYAAWKADLVCSGHVHGGIVRVPFWGKGVLSPNVRLFPKYDGGVYRHENAVMLLSRGLGMHTFPFRIFNPGEINLIELRRKS